MNQIEVADDIGTVVAEFLEFKLDVVANSADPGQLQFFTVIFVKLPHTKLAHGCFSL